MAARGLTETMLDDLDDETRVAVLADDAAVAAAAMLDVVDAMAPFSATVPGRSRWLAAARPLFEAWEESWPLALEPRLLMAIGETAIAAHETSAALTALAQAVELAAELELPDVEAQARATRLPWLPTAAMAAERAAIEAAMLRADGASAAITGRVHLARAASFAAEHDWEAMRGELARLGRVPLPRDERMVWVAYASQLLLAQMHLREQQRTQAARALMEAARIVAEVDSGAELANLQALVAAFAVRTGSFEAAMTHANASVDALARSLVGHAQRDPWLGMPLDLGPEREVRGVIRACAEGVIAAQEAGDRVAFLVCVSALVAFYLGSDRAPEALDALTEAQQAAADLGDGAARALLRSISESLLRYIGMLS